MRSKLITQSDIQEFGKRLSAYCQRGMRTEKPEHREHQVEAHQAVISDLKDMKRPQNWWSLMVMATGSGKSFTAGKEIKAFNTPAGAKHPVWDYPALIVTSRLSLTEQFKHDLAETTGIPESAMGIFSSESKSPVELQKPLLIVPYPTFMNLSKAGAITPKNRPLLVLDEAHNAIGATAMKEIHDKWRYKSYIQCWTATDKVGRKTVAQVLFDAHTDPDVDDATYRLTLKEAAERGITAPLKSMVLETQFESGAKPTAAGAFRPEDEEKIVNQKGRMQALIRLCHGDYLDKFGVDFRGMKTLVFAPGVTHGKNLAKEFNKVFGAGYAVAVSGEDTPRHELNKRREGSIAWRFQRGDLKQGDPRIIIADRLIEEGVDLPDAQLCVEEVPTFSERVETQRVGRVVRKVNGKEAYSVVMLDKGQEGAAIIGEIEGWELKPEGFTFPVANPLSKRMGGRGNSLPDGYPDIEVRVVADARHIEEFRQRRRDELGDIPKTPEGQEYVQGPNQKKKHENAKYYFFTAAFNALPDTGFSLDDGKHIPKDEVRKKFGSARAYYYHPVAYAAWDQRFAKERLTEIPTTTEGLEYIKGPTKKNKNAAYRFFIVEFNALPDTGFPLGDGKHIPKEEVRKKLASGAYYYHPVAYAAWDQRFEERLTEIPTTTEELEYIQGPISTQESNKFNFFTAEFNALPDNGFPLGDGKHIPKEEVRKKLASGAYYYHPVAYAAWDQRFAKERLTEIPTAGKGQTYVQGPVSVHEGVKYEFFTAEFKALPDTGFPLGGGKHIPKDEVRKKVGNTYYYHPVVRAAWDQRFAKEKLTEIPITSEGQEYVLGPNQKREQTKHKFFTAAFDALPDTGFPLGGGKHIPKDEVRGKFGTAYYYHPVAYAAWDKAFNNRKSIIEAADAGDGEKNDDTPEGGRQTSPHGGFSNITDLKAKPITQKDLTPGSKDLRRTGRSRTVDED